MVGWDFLESFILMRKSGFQDTFEHSSTFRFVGPARKVVRLIGILTSLIVGLFPAFELFGYPATRLHIGDNAHYVGPGIYAVGEVHGPSRVLKNSGSGTEGALGGFDAREAT